MKKDKTCEKMSDKVIHWIYCHLLYDPHTFFFIVAILIVGPFFTEGYLFLFDWGIESGSIDLWNHSLFHMMIIMLGEMIGYPLFPKILCFLMIYFLGMVGYYFGKTILEIWHKKNVHFISLIIGFFFIINPFVYARAIDGQWYVLFGMGAGVVMVIYMLKWIQYQKNIFIIIASLWGVITVLISQHAVFFVVAIVLLCVIFKIIQDKKIKDTIFIPLFLGMIVLFNINIIIGYTFHMSPNSDVLKNIDEQDYDDFQSVANGNASLTVNLLSLHGYWGERENRFISTQEKVYVWKPIFLIFMYVVFCGIFYKRKKNLTWLLVLFCVIGIVGAFGLAGPFGFINRFLYDNLIFYHGLREPQKWISVYMIGFMGLFTFGLLYVHNYVNKRFHVLIFLIISGFIVLYTPTMFLGFSQQVFSQTFPTEWHEARQSVLCENNKENTIFLPYDNYINVDFLNGKKITNPGKGFFRSCIFDDREINIYSDCDQFAHNLKKQGIEYIIVSESANRDVKYHLDEKKCLQSIKSGLFINVFKVIDT
jgi:hypothetical protein